MTIGEHIAINQPETYRQLCLLWINPLKQQDKGQLMRGRETTPLSVIRRLDIQHRDIDRLMREIPGFWITERLPR